MKYLLKPALLAFLVALAIAPGPAGAGEDLKITDTVAGTGDMAIELSQVTVHYTGWLMDETKFDSSIGKEPFSFTLGSGMVIPGWDQGVRGMRVGGKRQLIVPPHLAYGKRGAGGIIPPDATLRFEIELLAVAPPKFTNIDNEKLKELLARGVRIIDVRRPEEWKQTGIIKGSVMIQSFLKSGRLRRDFIEELARTVKKDEPVILICLHGNRSIVLSEGLSEQYGYTNIYNVTRGIDDWIKKGNPVVKP